MSGPDGLGPMYAPPTGRRTHGRIGSPHDGDHPREHRPLPARTWHPDSVTKYMQSAEKAANLPLIGPHGLYHTFGTTYVRCPGAADWWAT